ncbi:hypothetical protein Cpap_0547 [Ruminiclostridium papyrosolvens DSM 2782]|uniref:Uncharacterized protein n=1 Tax=Ruminiclostridium papyrosolvens DSM 2782 TaxID=588581 RepID=F1TI09_9FIRM|nr:hypothetical protein [Ruminiclostridium papyrosolvens]EGD45944.1 hypothetical protein Cpap_0547 [Ruminiclostridium papyrosolvens DSM 2782]WES33666.1 hypothetical protein P0092_18130 [Ruminiclostridium papyrosolvens DSM 2782]
MRRKEKFYLKGNESDIKDVMITIFPDSLSPELGIIENIYTDTPEYLRLINECKNRNIDLFFRSFEMEYTKSDLERAEYFVLNVNSYCSEFSDEYDTEYSYDNKCSCCGSGRTQISDLYIDKSKMGKKEISVTYDLVWVISDKIYRLFIENGITGVEFGNVHHKKNGKIKSEPLLYQLKSSNTLPPLNEKSVFFKEKFCECCKKSGLFLHSLPYYNMENLKNAKDVNYTYEYFGAGFSGRPYIIVSKKVYKLLKANKIKGVKFDIVNILK